MIKGHNMNTKKKNGFTIIEVVLVLAIAGLIFLMVFIALPALQRSQRDTQRDSDIARAMAAVTSFQKVNRNRVPEFGVEGARAWGSCDPVDADGFCGRYLLVAGTDGNTVDTFEDPDGTPYMFVDGGAAVAGGAGTEPRAWSNEDDRHRIFVHTNATCDGEDAVPSSGARKIAFRYALEGGGIICSSN